MDIKPVNLPTSAGVDFGQGDVRHFSEGDGVDLPSLQNPTRHLAQRDNLLAEKVNEVVKVVNNKEQFVPLAVPRTSVAPATEELITNFRIPPGFEARVINAAVASMPASSDIQLNVYFANGYGNTTGLSVASSTAEFTSGVSFYNDGEFILTLKNMGGVTLDCVGSVTLTVRPIGSQASLLVGSVIQGPQGAPGQKGDQGPKGDPGVGGTGSPGIVWKNAWQNGVTYNAPTDAVSFPLYGTLTSSFIAAQTHVASPSNQPPNASFWSPIAIGSSGSTTTNITITNISSGSIPNYFSHYVQATLITGSDWQGLAINNYDGSVYSTGTTGYFTCTESFIESATNNPGFNRGFAALGSVLRLAFRGHGTIVLPKQAAGARTDYSTNSVGALVSVHGTVPNLTITPSGSIATLVTAYPTASDSITLANLNASPLWVEIVLSGNTTY